MYLLFLRLHYPFNHFLSDDRMNKIAIYSKYLIQQATICRLLNKKRYYWFLKLLKMKIHKDECYTRINYCFPDIISQEFCIIRRNNDKEYENLIKFY